MKHIKARQSLIDVYHQVELARLPPPQITFTGISHFDNKVLYINPVKDAHLDVLARIAEICRETYEKNGITSTDVREFNPHLTLFKLSKARDLHRKGIKKIDQCWDSKYTDHHFGIENCRSIHLCNMMKKQQDGYYEIFHEQHLFNDDSDSFHPPSNNISDEIEKSVEIDNVILSSVQVDDKNIEQTSTCDRQTIIIEPMIDDSTVTDESSPLLQHDQPTSEEPSSSLVRFFHFSRSPCCSSCSIA
ncbi:unnamed protein product [Rotaria sp. Silwood2]|nr:unnamed protein product [Rotaria sp. Silwood2]CAF2736082.1 unnamed protein product [Rotaria sp. Silwood2]CAF3095675.1 unnamed protein product [Rotaria sp. Silwood2]CAF4012205.1 unnamed protein product [Rotaria sp. Silwood2]CAF4354043.1 unnamed protein product [Rotaria sp. Silwood2]